MLSEFDKPYNPKEHEDKIYKLWEESGFFNPDNLPNKKGEHFTIALPPPNVTGSLHMGHALNATIQDILIRKKRMESYQTLWLPGTDHAGIATQNVVERDLKKQGISRHDLGREKFLEKVWEWKEKYGDIILDQLKKMGASCDWSRTRFTMDTEYQEAVKIAFLHYQKKGWIYQGERVISWCARCRTSLSDLELEYQEEKGKLWFIKYPLAEAPTQGRSDDFVVVATTRPETMLGDSAVAVNPKDKRYKNLIGKKIILPIKNHEIPIVSDRRIEMDFGTGAVKITPAHDMLDEQIAITHKLPAIQIINEKGRMTKEAGEDFDGLKILEAREKVVKKLEELGLIEKIEDYTHNIAKCYRCGTTVEPLRSKQWFLKMSELAQLAMRDVKNKKVKFHPKKWEKIYLKWLSGVKDWCISRQIWWGHKIPIDGVDDVLDTWFSSALWPFATLGWPRAKSKGSDLEKYYPTQVLSTARDIINLWVARMVFSGVEFLGVSPFSDVIIHATILAKDGRRMSKSLGTGVNPMDLINKYGADATRFGLIWQAMGGQDIHWSEEHVVAGKKFCNKIWNAARFVLKQCQPSLKSDFGSQKKSDFFPGGKTSADKKILAQLKKTQKQVDKLIDKYEFGQALHILYDFFWHDFCDVYLEESKKNPNPEVLARVLKESLKLLHPFMPFITEHIWSKLPGVKNLLIIEEWAL
ncbi:MAG: valine--tRNA ligase [Candidatus Giovannonibacteria bacterium]|nr:valine--tRNA ligase [Candidatus Giovannonibacteria bacterium]